MYSFSTLDLLYLVLSVAILWVAIFLCGTLWHLAGTLKRVNEIIDKTKRQVEKVQEAIATLREGMERAMTYTGLVAKGGDMLLDVLGKKKKGRRKKDEE